MSKNVLLARLLLDIRVIGMEHVEWGHMFAQFDPAWSERIMYGLSYACYLDGDEQFLWVDVDGRDNSDLFIWPHDRFRLFAPAEFLISYDPSTGVTSDQFDRFFAVQFLEHELNGTPGLPLGYFAEYPNRMNLTIRGEQAFETEHFYDHGTSNFGGKPLFDSVRKLRDHLLKDLDDGSEKKLEMSKFVLARKIKRLFPGGDQI